MGIKLLVLADGLGQPDARGTEIISETLDKLPSKNIQVKLITTLDHFRDSVNFYKWINSKNKKGIEVFVVDVSWLSRRNRYLAHLLNKFLTFLKAIEVAFKFRPDIVHEYSSTPIMFLRTFLVSIIGGSRSVHTLITYNDKFWSSGFWGVLGNLLDVVIIPSNGFSAKYSRFLKDSNIRVISQGVNSDRFASAKADKKRFEIPSGKQTILYLGPPEVGKGFDLYLNAIDELEESDSTFYLFVFHRKLYDYEYDEAIIKTKNVFEHNEKKFKIIEMIVDVPTLLRSVEVVVLPQINHHGTLIYPQTLLEAMAAGAKVVASKSTEISEIVNRRNGFLFRNGDPIDLARAISKALSSDGSIGVKASSDIKKYHDLDVVIDKTIEVYKSII